MNEHRALRSGPALHHREHMGGGGAEGVLFRNSVALGFILAFEFLDSPGYLADSAATFLQTDDSALQQSAFALFHALWRLGPPLGRRWALLVVFEGVDSFLDERELRLVVAGGGRGVATQFFGRQVASDCSETGGIERGALEGCGVVLRVIMLVVVVGLFLLLFLAECFLLFS